MKRILLLLAIICCTQTSFAQMTTRVVRDSLFIPWELVYGPDNHVWFTQKNGYVCRLNPVNKKIDTLIHETAVYMQGEGGMLGMALHPDFSNNPYVYVAYNYLQSGSPKERIVRYTYNSTTNTLGSYLTLLDNINAGNIHNGCRLLIVGDKLFITTGDAGVDADAQNINSLNGKVLRINLDGSIPADNPYPDNPVWTWGHRNSQGLVYFFGNLVNTEHGPTTDDELNVIEKGKNYGWPDVVGKCDNPTETAFCLTNSVKEPACIWTPTIAVCGVDFYDYTLPMLPVFKGQMIMTTLKDSLLYTLETNPNAIDSGVFPNVVPLFGNSYGRLRDVCISTLGSVFVSTSNSPANGTANPIDKIIEIYDPSFTNVSDVARKNAIEVYPNPTTDFVVVRINQSESSKRFAYTLTTTDGKTVDHGVMKSNDATLNMSGLLPGIYQLKLTDNTGKSYNRSILKQ